MARVPGRPGLPTENPMDVVGQILQFNAGRDPETLQVKHHKMRSDVFAFMRGSCHLFYQRLPRSGVFKSAPVV